MDDLASAQGAPPRRGLTAPMKSKTRIAVAAGAVTLVALAGSSGGTFASFSGATRNGGNDFALTSLYAPGNVTALPTGHSVEVTWTPGQNGDGYKVLSAPAPNPLVNDCTGASFSALATVTATTHLDALATLEGTWRCYTVQTSYHSWTSVQGNPVAAARLGFVASIVTFANGGNGSRIDAGDTFTITFNQAVATATGPQSGNSICWQNDRIVLGSTQSGSCTATDASPRLGFLTGGAIDRNFRFAATWDWSTDNRVLTITVGNRLSGSGSYSTTGTWTFTPTPNPAFVQSASGGFHVCDSNATGGNCLPTVAGL